MSKKERDYDEFTRLKDKKCSQVMEDNAAKMLKATASQTVSALQELDVENIIQVEDIYLIIAQLTQAASYVAAQNRAAKKNISFDEALKGIGTPEVMAILEGAFKNKFDLINFSKFITIDKEYNPAKQAWAGLHSRMDEMARQCQNEIASQHQQYREHVLNVLNEQVPAYKEHLEEKLKKNGVDITNREIKDDTPKVIKKLILRYNAITDLHEKISSPAHWNIDEAQKSISTCLANTPDWLERPFLQKLTDVLSLGFKPLYRAFFSKEKDFQESMDKTLNPPRM